MWPLSKYKETKKFIVNVSAAAAREEETKKEQNNALSLGVQSWLCGENC